VKTLAALRGDPKLIGWSNVVRNTSSGLTDRLRRDPRLRLAIVITTLQVLGQTVLGFKLSIAQILVSLFVCGSIEVAITYWRRRVVVWPASAILTGNSVAFILRTTGTQHGDWWSLNGIQYFVLAALIGILSKYLIRPGGRHIYNPSNLGLVLVLLVAGPTHVFPQYLWWGPMNLPVTLTWAVIIGGSVFVLRSLRMLPMVASFLIAFTALITVFALQDQCFYAVWRATPVCGLNYWIGIALSPELAIFVLLMMSDPKTAPAGVVGRAIYGTATALVAAALIYLQPSEWGIKLALLASLTIVCSFVPLIERVQARVRPTRGESPTAPRPRWTARPLALAALVFSLTTAVGVTLAVPFAVVGVASDKQVLEVDHPSAPNTPGLQ
jgi:hypothetical protein